MAVLFDADVPVHYGFINLIDADADDQADLMDSRAGQVNGLAGAAVPGELSLVTGLHTGRVRFVVRWHDNEPVIGDGWEDVVEVSFRPPSANLLLTSFQDSFGLLLPAVGSLRAASRCPIHLPARKTSSAYCRPATPTARATPWQPSSPRPTRIPRQG